jgi:Flp pilus assembly protein TadD
MAASAALLLGLGAATATRSRVYADEVTFWGDVVEKAPGNARAHANLGYALALACRSAEAAASLERALELDPGQFRAAANLRLLREGAFPDASDARCSGARPASVR